MNILLIATMLALGADYDAKLAEAERTQQPLLVVVGATWCGPCRRLKNVTIPRARRRGYLDDVVYAHVDYDHDRRIAEPIVRRTEQSGIPVMALYWKEAGRWKAKYHVGGISLEQLRNFLEPQTE